MLVGGHGSSNPNTNWLKSRGLWISYILGILAIHLFFLSLPGVSISVAWTVTNVTNNILHIIIFHTIKGAPWLSQDQGASRGLTHWEQIDDGVQHTATRKFLTLTPLVMFLLTSVYTMFDPLHFYINLISLFIVVTLKQPLFSKLHKFK